jgi:hypothetical protein
MASLLKNIIEMIKLRVSNYDDAINEMGEME